MNFNNLHALASTIIPQQSMEWVRFKENSENRHGAQRRNYSPHDGHMGHVENALVSKTVQVQAFRKHDITDLNDYTASDLCAVVKMIISSLPYIELLQSQGVEKTTYNPC